MMVICHIFKNIYQKNNKMYIISNFKDIYDSVAHTKGIDKSIIYERYTQELELSNNDLRYYNFNKRTSYISSDYYLFNYTTLSPYILGFCGKIYIVGVKITEEKDKYNTVKKTTTNYIYDFNEIIESYKGKYYYSTTVNYLTELKNSNKLQEIFHKYKTPSFVIKLGTSKLIINPILKNFDFHKHMDIFTIFQEIEMFISGVIGVNTKPIVEISDKHKIIGHGFDFKYSFRKDKQS